MGWGYGVVAFHTYTDGSAREFPPNPRTRRVTVVAQIQEPAESHQRGGVRALSLSARVPTAVYYILPLYFIRRCKVRAASWRSLMIAIGRWLLCQRNRFWSFGHPGATPSVGFVRTVESKDVHLPSKKHPSSPKMGVSRCRP